MFKIRYLVDDQYYDATNGPIFFYTGSENDIWTSYHQSGWMAGPLARNLSALVVFAEHRFYGQSTPSNTFNESLNQGLAKHLSVENTLLDYVKLIKQIKIDYKAEKRSVIAFGGGYGGMLAAWMRMKYPHAVQGAIASSAPVSKFNDSKSTDKYGYDDIITDVF